MTTAPNTRPASPRPRDAAPLAGWATLLVYGGSLVGFLFCFRCVASFLLP